MNRLHSLDGLRALACLLVLTHHLGTAALAAALSLHGYLVAAKLLMALTASGVELFFVLSATVLVGPYVRGHKALKPGPYLWRRVQRLMPPYLAAWLLAGFAVFMASEYPTWWTASAALPPFSITTWLEQIGIVYLGAARYNFAWWSLTTEVAFYLTLPLFIPLFTRLHQRTALLVAAFVGSVVLALFADRYLPFSLLVLRELAIYASCFCAGLVLAGRVPGRALAHAMWLCGLVWIGLACTLTEWNIHVGWGLVYFGIVALAMHPETLVNRRLSSFNWVWLGERSYSLFLVHYSVIGLVCQAVSFWLPGKSTPYFVWTRLLSIVFSMLAAILVFHLIERRTARNLATGNALWPWSGQQRHAGWQPLVRGA